MQPRLVLRVHVERSPLSVVRWQHSAASSSDQSTIGKRTQTHVVRFGLIPQLTVKGGG